MNIDELVALWKALTMVMGDLDLFTDHEAWNALVEARRQAEILLRSQGLEGEEAWVGLPR